MNPHDFLAGAATGATLGLIVIAFAAHASGSTRSRRLYLRWALVTVALWLAWMWT